MRDAGPRIDPLFCPNPSTLISPKRKSFINLTAKLAMDITAAVVRRYQPVRPAGTTDQIRILAVVSSLNNNMAPLITVLTTVAVASAFPILFFSCSQRAFRALTVMARVDERHFLLAMTSRLNSSLLRSIQFLRSTCAKHGVERPTAH